MANPCLKLIKGNNALETHFAGIEKLPIEQQREAILNKAKEYHEILYNELEALKITINPNHKVIKFSPDGSVGKNPQQAGSGSRNNNVPKRESGEIQTKNGEQGNTNTGSQGVDLANLQKEYESKSVEDLVALKKKLYPNPDIESSMLPEEKK